MSTPTEEIKFDLADDPNWDLEIQLIMGAVERGALAHRIRAWGRQQFADGRVAALAELHPQWLAEKERADRLQAQTNEGAFDKLLADVPSYCAHQFEPDGQSHGKTFWRCSKCGAERRR